MRRPFAGLSTNSSSTFSKQSSLGALPSLLEVLTQLPALHFESLAVQSRQFSLRQFLLHVCHRFELALFGFHEGPLKLGRGQE
jgi:hypothetical protein